MEGENPLHSLSASPNESLSNKQDSSSSNESLEAVEQKAFV